MEDIDNGTTDNTNSGAASGTESGTTGNETTPKSLPTGDSPNKSLPTGEDSNKSIDVGEDPHKTLPTRDHETKKINESSHENKANDEAYEEPKEEVKADLFNLDYFDKPEEAPQEVTEKASELINGDLNYFDNWIAEAEDQKKQNKEQLDAYLKSNVESGNQLAYTQEDLNSARQAADDAINALSTTTLSDIYLGDLTNAPASFAANIAEWYDRVSNGYRNIASKEEALQKLREDHPTIANNISDEALNSWADSIVTHNKQRQIQEDMGRNGPTVNSGISKAEETALLDKAVDDWDSLSDTEKEKAYKYLDAFEANPHDPAFGELRAEPLNPLEPVNSLTNRAIAERNRERERRSIRAELARDAIRTARNLEREGEEEDPTPETPRTSTSEPTRTEPARTEETPETPTSDVTPTEETSTTETPTEVATAEDTETESSETSEDEIPEEIEEPSEETHTVMDAIEGLDDSRRWWEFGSEDYERTRHQIARISPTAEEEFMDFADLINDIVNGSAGDKIKAVLKLVSKAAYDTFNILPKVCVDVAKDIVYRLIKGDYDTSGLTEGEQKQVQRFSHNRQNVNMMNAMLDTMDKPVNSSIRGKGRGQATDEADYNEGMIEDTNDVVSDVTKKYIISQPWLFKAIQRW